MPNDETVNVRYMVDDVDESIAFYTKLLGFELLTSAAPAFADVKRGNLRLLLAGPTSSAGRPMPDGAQARAGRLEPHPLHRRRPRRRGRTAPRRRRDVPQRHRRRARRQADPAPGPVRQRRRAVPARVAERATRPMTSTHRGRDAVASPSLLTIAARVGADRRASASADRPPHIALLRDLCVERRRWLTPSEFEDAIAACNLLPGPASTQLAIFSAWRVAGPRRRDRRRRRLHRSRARHHPRPRRAVPRRRRRRPGSSGAGAGAGAAVAAVAVRAGRRPRPAEPRPGAGPLAVGALRAPRRHRGRDARPVARARAARLRRSSRSPLHRPSRDATLGTPLRGPLVARPPPPATGGVLALVWVAFKVGALSYGGGFVIIPLMQADAVAPLPLDDRTPSSSTRSRSARSRPGPVVQTVAVVGYAAAGRRRRSPRRRRRVHPVVRLRAPRRAPLRPPPHDPHARAFLDGAGPAAIGAIIGVAIPLALALERGVAVRGPRRRGGRAPRAPPRRRRDPPRRRARRARCGGSSARRSREGDGEAERPWAPMDMARATRRPTASRQLRASIAASGTSGGPRCFGSTRHKSQSGRRTPTSRQRSAASPRAVRLVSVEEMLSRLGPASLRVGNQRPEDPDASMTGIVGVSPTRPAFVPFAVERTRGRHPRLVARTPTRYHRP